jgi:hypothetical protein
MSRRIPFFSRFIGGAAIGAGSIVGYNWARSNRPQIRTGQGRPEMAIRSIKLSRIFPVPAAVKEQNVTTLLSRPTGTKLPFDDGKISSFTEQLAQVEQESTVPVLAFWSYLADFKSQYRGTAGARRTALLMKTSPNPAAFASAEIGRQAAQEYGDDQLTTELSLRECEYMYIMHGFTGRSSLDQLAQDLTTLTETLDRQSSLHRQASARLILGHVFHLLGRDEEARGQLNKAFELSESFINDTQTRGGHSRVDVREGSSSSSSTGSSSHS